jgi:hypothetical protein
MLNTSLTIIICCAVCLSQALFCQVEARADEGIAPLHQQIDRLIAEATVDHEKHGSEPVSDAGFLRRIFLDLTGRIPSLAQAREFFKDNDADKRVHTIDGLLKSPEHVRHLQHQFDVMLMQRLPQKYVDVADWREYLFTSIRKNKSWDALTREILTADGFDPEHRAPARFLLDRELKSEETTRDLARVFLGRDLQCAQCHDHPTIDDYAQQHYFGIRAFLNRSYLFTDPKSKQTSIGEKAVGTVKFTSVFTSVQAETSPQMLNLPPIADPEPDKEPYVAKPEKTTRGIPRYSRRLLLARAVTDPANRDFRLNIANRLWALVMGRGLVEPLDMFHSENPPSHPQLLDLLADDLAEHGYDMRRTLREIVRSETYQRSSRLSHEEADESERYYTGLLKPLSPEQLAWSMMQASGIVQDMHRKMVVTLQNDAPAVPASTGDFACKLESLINKQLGAHVDTFVTVFASANESSRFDATANQALFVLNGTLIGEWLEPLKNNLTDRLLKCEDSNQVAEELFLSLLTRLPTESEITAVNDLLRGSQDDRQASLKQAVRSILCSAEFRFNH